MQRIIKFRFVYKHSETGEIKFHFCTLDELLEEPLDENKKHLTMYVISRGGYDLISKDQYIGMKDKNGNEIYEDDIVKRHIAFGLVKFNDGAFGFQACTQYDDDFYSFTYPKGNSGTNYDWEVIGSSHKNPELLQVAS